MRVLIVYGTTEGHTRDLSHFAARCLKESGRLATVEQAGPDDTHPDPSAYDAAILAASLHVGRYKPALVHFVRTHHQSLNAMPSAFISVSLASAGINPHDWEGLDECLVRFEHETLWTPKAIHQAAGAIRYSQYDFFKRLTLKYIAAQRGHATVTSRDYDLTDYVALKAFVLDFAEQAEPTRAPARRPEVGTPGQPRL